MNQRSRNVISLTLLLAVLLGLTHFEKQRQPQTRSSVIQVSAVNRSPLGLAAQQIDSQFSKQWPKQVSQTLHQTVQMVYRLGRKYLPSAGTPIVGVASWYGPMLHGQVTANGERFDQNHLTAAHPDLPFNTYLRVTNLRNHKWVIVRINDRHPGPDRRLIDLSKGAAAKIGAIDDGIVPVRMEVVDPQLEAGDTGYSG